MQDNIRRELAEGLANLLPTFHRKFVHKIAFPIPPNPFLTLVTLNDHGTQTLTELSKRVLMSKQQMSPIVDKLLDAGYVERTQDKTDRRSVKISITPAGFAILAGYHEKTCDILFEDLQVLSASELKKLNHTLTDMVNLINKL